MPNRKNIQKVIDHISEDNGTHFRMGNWVIHVNSAEDKVTDKDPSKYIECGTAFCIGGLTNLIRLEEEGFNPKAVFGYGFRVQFGSEHAAAEWLGINKEDASKLFKSNPSDTDWTLRFDALPAETRRAAAINVLTHLMETGDVDWEAAIAKAQRT